MQKQPFNRRYPTLAADFAGLLSERDIEASEILIFQNIIKTSSKSHTESLLKEISMMIHNQDIKAEEIQDWGNIWLDDNDEKAKTWMRNIFDVIYAQALEIYGKSINIANDGVLKMETDIRQALACMDLTTLNDNDTIATVQKLCAQASSEAGNVAAVCVYPEFITTAHKALKAAGASDIKVATVTNFPHGGDDMDIALRETSLALGAGADEVDLVFPYHAWLNGNKQIGIDMVKKCKELCLQHNSRLKVIIETGMLKDVNIIREVSLACIEAGADFIKTSTGKVPVNATLESTKAMLEAIKEAHAEDKCGFKAAGGVRTAAEAAEYLALARQIMGEEWVNPHNFRFGASSLLGSLLEALGMESQAEKSNY